MQYCSWLNYSVVVRTNIHWTASNPKAGADLELPTQT